MKILKIVVKGYRVLENATVPLGHDYCAISGKNNAGKSCIIELLSALLHQESMRPWHINESEIEYKEDKTQWIKEDSPIETQFDILLNRSDDASLVTFVEKLAGITSVDNEFTLSIKSKYLCDGSTVHKVDVSKTVIDGSLAKDVLQKLKTSNLMFLHNSASHEERYYGRNRRLALVEFVLSEQEKRQIIDAEVSIQKRIKKFAKQHKEELQTLLGKMEEKYSVNFSTIDASYARHIPLGVRLEDKHVDVPINEWGSGTQNKTYILLSILWASRIKTQGKADEKITPIVIIEEPESFLHPTAQAEFGKLLTVLASELGIQIIVTTHSPYMLNRDNPSSNLLFRRPIKYNRKMGCEIVVPSGNVWMLPFAEHLGLPQKEFENWSPLFAAGTRKILLVEGPVDKEYIDFIHKNDLVNEKLPDDIEVVPYGGKDALKNTLLLKFTLEKYDETYITFDLDVINEVRRAIEAIGYERGKTYFPVGLEKVGHKDIEGLLPDRVRKKVFSSCSDLVTRAIGGDKVAKDELKRKYLEEFKSHFDYTEKDMNGFSDLFKSINKGIKANKVHKKG
jgi:putative ATP-dependent endonuclease of the OLD family